MRVPLSLMVAAAAVTVGAHAVHTSADVTAAQAATAWLRVEIDTEAGKHLEAVPLHPTGGPVPDHSGRAPTRAKHLAQITPVTDAANDYTFADRTGSRADLWSACAAIRVLVNISGAPTGSLSDIKAAISRIAVASGLHIIYAGTSTRIASSEWGLHPQHGHWAPVLIGWAKSGTHGLDGSEVGSTFNVTMPRRDGGPDAIVSSSIVLDQSRIGAMAPGFGMMNSRGSVYLHELAHVAGLGHVKDATQIMNPVILTGRLGTGDLAGLRAAGRGACFAAPAP